MSIEVFYDIISPYSYLGLELLAQSELATKEEIIITPVSLGSILGETGNPGPANISAKRSPALYDCCLQAKFHNIEIVGPAAHPFIPLVPMRFIHSIAEPQEKLQVALLVNRLCWVESQPVDSEENLVTALEKSGNLKEEWRDMRTFIKNGGGRKSLKAATARALELGVFGVPTFRTKDTNFWGSDRIALLQDFISYPNKYENTHFERMNTLPSGM